MTGADNPTLARRSCETIRTLGPGTSEEDRASRALGALAVLAVGQMECIIFPIHLEKLCLVVVVYVVRFSSRQRGKTTVPVVVVVFLFSSTSISSTKVSRLRALSDAFYISPRLMIAIFPLFSPLFQLLLFTQTMLDERFRDKIGTRV